MTKNIFLLLLTLSFFQFSSCVVEEDPSAVTEFKVSLKWKDVAGSDAWDEFLMNALDDYGSELMDEVPADIASFSPGYVDMNYFERRNFWAYLISIMAQRESSFRPEASFTEAFTDVNGERVVSRGLLQLSIESARGYQCPFLDVAEDLHKPEVNLICSVLIMKRWVVQDGVISGKEGSRWRGGARYWSVLRKDSTLSFFTGFTTALF